MGKATIVVLAGILLLGTIKVAQAQNAGPRPGLERRWLFMWRNMSDPKDVDRTIALFPRAQKDGYNGVVFGADVAPGKAEELKAAAKQYGLDLIVLVMGGTHDRNYEEGVLCKDALFLAQGGRLVHQQDNPTKVLNGDFEDVAGDHFKGWAWQDTEGVTTFADHEVVHGGKASLRMENYPKNPGNHCRIEQPLKLEPYRQYHVSVWVKTEGLVGADPRVMVLTPDASQSINFQTFHVEQTQDWKRYDIVFNSLDHTEGNLYLGTWGGEKGKLWWDDLSIDEIGLVNVLRRPGCPVTVRGENGTVYEEGRDYERIVDPRLHPWIAYHDEPVVKLPAGTRISEGEKLRISYYHSIIVYEDRITSCLSEPKIFDDWRAEVVAAEKLLHPAAFFMQHDELRVINQCASCQAMKMTPGQLLAWNIKKAAQIIRDVRPDAGIWVWSDMFDPMHNAVDHFYAVNGPLKGSWEGLSPDVGIVNWNGGRKGKNCQFFADLGCRQILSGYYDGDEGGAGIAEWLDNTKGVKGIVGAMYTTWEDRYGPMDLWAAKAWGGGR